MNPFLAGADLGAVRAPAVERTGPVTVAAREAVLAVTGPVQWVAPESVRSMLCYDFYRATLN